MKAKRSKRVEKYTSWMIPIYNILTAQDWVVKPTSIGVNEALFIKSPDGFEFLAIRDEDPTISLTATWTGIFNRKYIPKGASHLYEHMSFRRVKIDKKYYKSDEFHALMSEKGIDVNARTRGSGIEYVVNYTSKEAVEKKCRNKDNVAQSLEKILDLYDYDTTEDRSNISLAFKVLYGLVFGHSITQEDLDKEKAIVKTEICDVPRKMTDIMNNIFPTHYDFIGKLSNIDACTVRDCELIQNVIAYSANKGGHMRFTISGYITANMVLEFVDVISKFANTKKYKEVNNAGINWSRKYLINRHTIKKPTESSPSVTVAHPASSLVFYSHFDFGPATKMALIERRILVALIQMLNSDLSSPLVKKFRIDIPWVYGITSKFVHDAHSTVSGTLLLILTVHNEIVHKGMLEEAKKHLADIMADFTQELIDKNKKEFIHEFLLKHANTDSSYIVDQKFNINNCTYFNEVITSPVYADVSDYKEMWHRFLDDLHGILFVSSSIGGNTDDKGE